MDEEFEAVVIWFNNKSGFGFLEWHKDGAKMNDLFVHYSDIDTSGYKTLKSGQKVTFGIGKNNKGQPKAVKVKVVSEK